MIKRIIIPLYQDQVAPRFDLATEVMVAIVSGNKAIEEPKNIVLQRSSPEDLCHRILSENINCLICGAIEDEYYQFLKWKKLLIYDNVSGSCEVVFSKFLENSLSSGDLLCERMVEGKNV
jgi:predicted Fe-Mo cluster-binding NifX family protein